MLQQAAIINKNIKIDTLSDGALIEKIKSGDIQAYAPLMQRYNQRFFRIARSIIKNDSEAMDVVQEAHLKAFMKIDKLKDTDKFSSWVGAITRNEALLYLRSNKSEASIMNTDYNAIDEVSLPLDDVIKSTSSRPDAMLENKQLNNLLNRYIDELPQNYRTVFVLRAVEQLSVKETAEIEEIKEETVKTRYFRAKRILRQQIREYLDGAGLHIYEFGGAHCDRIVKYVMLKISEKARSFKTT